MPLNDKKFAYEELMSLIRDKLVQSNLKAPQKMNLIDISLDNDFNANFKYEKDFWDDKSNSQYGQLINWPIGFAGIVNNINAYINLF